MEPERDQTEAVAGRVFVASACGNADAERHDEWDGHRTCGNAAGIKGNGEYAVRYKSSQSKDHTVKDAEQQGKSYIEQDPKHGDDKENADAEGDGENKRHVRYGRDLVGQHLQIRLGNGDHHADEQGDGDDKPKLSGLCHTGADMFAYGGHCDFRA